jgi:HTH-type transcriptional regulator/antitoxin HigA
VEAEVALGVSPAKYGRLLAKTLPKVIETRGEFDRYVKVMEELDRHAEESGHRLSPEEKALSELLLKLIEDYDDPVELPPVEPYKIVLYLMEQRGLRQVDLVPVFGSRSVASAVLNGKRAISKAHARKLADFFHLGVGAFL